MSVSEEERHELYLELERIHGREKATTLMSLLPPVGWADVATRQDLERLETRVSAELATVRAEMRSLIADVRTDIANAQAGQRVQLLLLFIALVGLQLSGAGIALGLRQIL